MEYAGKILVIMYVLHYLRPADFLRRCKSGVRVNQGPEGLSRLFAKRTAADKAGALPRISTLRWRLPVIQQAGDGVIYGPCLACAPLCLSRKPLAQVLLLYVFFFFIDFLAALMLNYARSVTEMNDC